MKKRLYLVHAQGRYGANCYAPFSVGVLWAYARTFPEIADAYEMVDFLYMKEPIADAVARLDRPEILGIAHYIWNAKWNMEFARAVRAKWPACTIIVGGVQVQDESPQTLEECEAFDFAVYGEGEGVFVDFLRAYASDAPPEKKYVGVGSLIRREHNGIVVAERRAFVPLEELRSPYLDGVFDELWVREPRWQILVEFDRGCGVGCHFCAWGQASQNKLRLFPEERIRAEIEWFGKHQVDYVDQCDANYGVVKRDLDLARALVAAKNKYGYPRTFRTSFAKNSNETVWEIANVLHDANMLKSVTLAMQSMDDDVLVNIHRKNIKFSKFGELIQRYEDAGIPTYTELILGLPGETKDTFLDGIDKNLEAGQHSGLFCYLNLLLNNTTQNTPEYMQIHGLRALPLRAMLSHGTPNNSDICEIQPVIVATAAMSHDDWKRCYMHSKVVEVFHSQGGLLREAAIAARSNGVHYRDFYGAFFDWCLERPETVAGREITAIARLLDNVLAGGSWDCVDARLGDVSWPPEEFAFARICLELDRFYDEVKPFVLSYFSDGNLDGIDLFLRQRTAISRPPMEGIDEWARETIWYGRRGKPKKIQLRQTIAMVESAR